MQNKRDPRIFHRPEPPGLPPFAHHLDDLRQGLKNQQLEHLASRCAGRIVSDEHGDALHLALWNTEYRLVPPEWVACQVADGKVAPVHIQGLLVYYLLTADGTSLSGRWIAFADLPGGRFYNAAYQGYTGDELARSFGSDLERFSYACLGAGGEPESLGDLAYRFISLPRLPVLAAAWAGDEDFPTAYRILFDESACHYLPTDVCAILGSLLTRRIMKASPTT